jgi:transcriptional regulator with XRE-family HTH domain
VGIVDKQEAPIGKRRSALGLTQQAAAQMAGVSVATWRRLESDSKARFRQSTVRAIEKVLRLPQASLEPLRAGVLPFDIHLSDGRRPTDVGFVAEASRYNANFDGDPLSPRMAASLAIDAEMRVDFWDSVERDSLMKGEIAPWEVFLLDGEPLSLLSRVNLVWFERLARTWIELRRRLDEGEVPYPRNLAEEVVLWQAIAAAEDDWADEGERWEEDPWNAYRAEPQADGDFEILREILFEDTDFLLIWSEREPLAGYAEALRMVTDPFSWWEPFR